MMRYLIPAAAIVVCLSMQTAEACQGLFCGRYTATWNGIPLDGVSPYSGAGARYSGMPLRNAPMVVIRPVRQSSHPVCRRRSTGEFLHPGPCTGNE